jgi:hypothetical protein
MHSHLDIAFSLLADQCVLKVAAAALHFQKRHNGKGVGGFHKVLLTCGNRGRSHKNTYFYFLPTIKRYQKLFGLLLYKTAQELC